MNNKRLYTIWRDMKRRCNDPRRKEYGRYGGRGISVCNEWANDFQTFYNWALNNGYNDTLTIERNDVNGNYEPSNCKWATKAEQANNKRNNLTITYNGKTQTVAQWSKELNISQSTIRNRIKQGLTDEEVLTITKGCGSKRGKAYNEQNKTIRQWAEYSGIPYKTLRKRVWDLHWDLEKALTTPVKKRGA